MTAQIALLIAIWRLRTERCREQRITASSTPSLLHSAAKNEVDADPSKLIKLSAGPAALSSVSAVPISQPSLDYRLALFVIRTCMPLSPKSELALTSKEF
jgi:hypothetical protein